MRASSCHAGLRYSFRGFSECAFLFLHPFSHEFDCMKIKEWISEVMKQAIAFKDIGAVVRAASHTDPDRLQHIQVLILATGLPPPPLFSSPLPHSLVRIDSVFRLLLSPP